jgi:four helix bundle protein
VSIAANIAEGHARSTRKDYAHFVSMARGSASELETLVILAGDAELVPREATAAILEKTERVARMLTRLHARLKEVPQD